MNAQASTTTPRVRHAIPADRGELCSLVNTSFKFDLAAELPHLFTDERICNHIIAECDGRIAGAVGLYPHAMRIGTQMFDVAGIGQVCTLPEMRGRGVMSAILAEVTRESDMLDFTWLFGDRLRYGRYGWAPGGMRYLFETYDKYLPAPPPPNIVRPFDISNDVPLFLRAVDLSHQAPLFARSETDSLFGGERGRQLCGWILDDAFILMWTKSQTVFFGDGTARELSALLAHAAREIRSYPDDKWKLTVECGPEPSPLMEACIAHYHHMRVQHDAGLRVGNLRAFLTKCCALAQPHVTHGDDSLSFVNTDNGQEATISCAKGRLSVTGRSARDARRLNTRELSEVLFSLCPLDALMPGVPPDSPLRHVFPLPVWINKMYSL
ncbi:GNAT family N-acetyltransferase [bacterium]|nr:GNAT family N-acetyltransferase [bacterium]